MSHSQNTSSHSPKPPFNLDPRLLDLLGQLRELPTSLSDHPSIYPFTTFVLDPYDIEHYGSAQAAVNHRLEMIFGSRSSGEPIQLRGRGASLEAIVYIFFKYIEGEDGDNILLWKWVKDIKQAACHATLKAVETVSQIAASSAKHSKCMRKSAGTCSHKKRPNAQIKAAKAATVVRLPHDPDDLEDDPWPEESGSGRSRDELLDKLTIPCHSIINPSHLRYRCSGTGCWWSWADPRGTTRVLRHATTCQGFDSELRAELNSRAASLSLASRLRGYSLPTEEIDPVVAQETRRQKEERVNHALLKWICDRMIPPSAVDCFRWREFVSAIDDKIKTASGDTISDNYMTTEAAYIHEASIRTLLKQENLTLTYDGGTTRKHESVYTVHATTPGTREAHLLAGNEASGVSHTAEHICALLNKVLIEVGPERFACIVSDNAGNTRAARALIEHEYPWIITLQDACHQQNNASKDIGKLAYFRSCITRLRSIITHFHTSSYAARHLSALRAKHGISTGLVAIGNTRFASYYYSARSILRCLPLILELLSSGVLDPAPASPIFWLVNQSNADQFARELRQLAAVLEPFARSIKCLESSHSTIADVYVFWLAVVARFQELFKYNSTVRGIDLPEAVIGDIRSIINGRHAEMFQGASNQVYLAAFFLDSRYRGSDVLAHRMSQHFNDLASGKADMDTGPSYDRDLRQSIPAYTLAGRYLVKLLARVYNKNPDAVPFSRYADWLDIEAAFRNQLVSFTRGLSPFNRITEASGSRAYWEDLRSAPAADLLAHLGLILTSAVPNSMAEERSMSTLTKLNSPDRACQSVSSLVNMATIRQHYKREENTLKSATPCIRPTVRFADLSRLGQSSATASGTQLLGMECDEPVPEAQHPSELVSEGEVSDAIEDPETNDYEGPLIFGNRDGFELEGMDGISLSSNFLLGLISDSVGTPTKHRLSESPTPTLARPHKRQRIDISQIDY